MKQAFDGSKFNFTKIDMEKEMIFRMVEGIGSGGDAGQKDVVTINVSPLEFGSSLILPDVYGGHPQVDH